MRKMKKIFAVLLTLAMVLGMSMTTMAATNESAKITIDNADGATLSYVQVIKPDQKSKTGWTFTNNVIAMCYMNAFNVTDPQDAILALIQDDGTSAKVAQALSNVANSTGVIFTPMENPQDVTVAGVYAIKGSEAGYTYNNMAAYVGFGEVKDEEGNVINSYPALLDVKLEAKKTPTTVEKESTDEDKVVAIGDTVTYTIKTTVPFIDPSNTNKTFIVSDNIDGAEYLPFTEENFSITMGDETISDANVAMTENGFALDLSELITANNSNAGKEITITYKAVVTAVTVENTAGSHVSDELVDSDKENLYTGQITLTKYDEDGETVLAGAGFEVRRIVPGLATTDALTFDKIEDGVYQYNPEGEVTEVFTKADGTVVVKGLDIGGYQFTETTAPEGYSINADGVTAVLEVEGDKAEAIITTSTSLKDTKLSSLPSTGGIGTTIFTIGGCLIMIIAAALFFSSRKKSAK